MRRIIFVFYCLSKNVTKCFIQSTSFKEVFQATSIFSKTMSQLVSDYVQRCKRTSIFIIANAKISCIVTPKSINIGGGINYFAKYFSILAIYSFTIKRIFIKVISTDCTKMCIQCSDLLCECRLLPKVVCVHIMCAFR